jgi:hypothetical protein
MPLITPTVRKQIAFASLAFDIQTFPLLLWLNAPFLFAPAVSTGIIRQAPSESRNFISSRIATRWIPVKSVV